MKLKKIEPRGSGRFLTRYDLYYEMRNQKTKVYEMVSRTPIQKEEDITPPQPNGVVMVVFNRDKTRLLLNREFRPAVGQVILNSPAGLREPGETPEDTVRRELKEETGLELAEVLGSYGSYFTSSGISNDSATLFVCTAEDTQPLGGEENPAEEIAPVWLTKEEARQWLPTSNCSPSAKFVMLAWATNVLR